jgi:hypothetical protein
LNSKANENGGVIYVKQMEGDIKIMSSTLTDFEVSDEDQGSLFYSSGEPNVKLTIDDSTITC